MSTDTQGTFQSTMNNMVETFIAITSDDTETKTISTRSDKPMENVKNENIKQEIKLLRETKLCPLSRSYGPGVVEYYIILEKSYKVTSCSHLLIMIDNVQFILPMSRDEKYDDEKYDDPMDRQRASRFVLPKNTVYSIDNDRDPIGLPRVTEVESIFVTEPNTKVCLPAGTVLFMDGNGTRIILKDNTECRLC